MTKSNFNTLHIISFDVPYPDDYGGVMDVFHKIRTLSDCDINIILHCFQYGRPKQEILEKYCSKVYYYPRKRYMNPWSGDIPYIVKSRQSKDLLDNLLKDNNPILFEGIHTTFYLTHPALKDRIKIVRNHNIEHEYYENLSVAETNFLKKSFFSKEAKRLKEYEQNLVHADYVLAISKPDTVYLKNHGFNAHWVSAFHPNDHVDVDQEMGDFIFYHGNLGVQENNKAALFLVNKVFSLSNFKVIIAGSNPSKELRQAVSRYSYITLKDDLSNKEIMQHIKEAQINTLITFQSTGIKLKLVNALFTGKHIIVNTPMVENTGLESLCHIADNPTEIAETIFNLWSKEISAQEIKERKSIIEKDFSNISGIEKLLNILRKSEKVYI